MNGWAIVCVSVVLFLVLSTGLSVSPFKFRRSQRKKSNCTNKDITIRAKCHEEQLNEEASAARNPAACCSLSPLHSGQANRACSHQADDDPSRMSTADENEGSDTHSSRVYILRVCEDTSVRLQCEGNFTCADVVRWRLADGAAHYGRTLLVQRARRGSDGGTYSCEVADFFGTRMVKADVHVQVQFAPVITVPNDSVALAAGADRKLTCQAEANPRPGIRWYREDTPLDQSPSSFYDVTFRGEGCSLTSFVLLKALGNASGEELLENFTCVAENELGRAVATFLVAAFSEELSVLGSPEVRRRFNVTGFIVGMLPPLFISFYIILKLGYRSRYAEERGEDDGYRDEPFFISY